MKFKWKPLVLVWSTWFNIDIISISGTSTTPWPRPTTCLSPSTAPSTSSSTASSDTSSRGYSWAWCAAWCGAGAGPDQVISHVCTRELLSLYTCIYAWPQAACWGFTASTRCRTSRSTATWACSWPSPSPGTRGESTALHVSYTRVMCRYSVRKLPKFHIICIALCHFLSTDDEECRIYRWHGSAQLPPDGPDAAGAGRGAAEGGAGEQLQLGGGGVRPLPRGQCSPIVTSIIYFTPSPRWKT